MTAGLFIVCITNAITLVIPPFFLFPSKAKKWTYPLMFLGCLGGYVIAELAFGMQFQKHDMSLMILVFVGILFLELGMLFATNFICAKGNLWRNLLLTPIYGHVISIMQSAISAMFPEWPLSKAYESLLLYKSMTLKDGLLCSVFSLSCALIVAVLLRVFVPVRSRSSERVFKILCIIYYTVTIAMAFGKQFLYYYSGNVWNHLIYCALVSAGVFVGLNLSGYFFNRLESNRIKKEQLGWKERADVLKRADTPSGSVVIDAQIKRMDEIFADKDNALELTFNRPYGEKMVLTEYETSTILRNLSELALMRRARQYPWTVMRVHWNEDLLMIYLEFNRNHDIRRLINQKPFEEIYDILNSHDGLLKIHRRLGTYEVKLMVF